MSSETTIHLIDTPEKLTELMTGPWSSLPEELALDLEADFDHFHYGKKLCLLQFSDGEEAWLIDSRGIDDITPVVEVIENPRVTKIMYSGDGDIMLLKETHDCHLKNIWDVQCAAKMVEKEDTSLAGLIQQIRGITIPKDKKMQQSDWTRRPLSAQQKEYAANDVLHLHALKENLACRLEEASPDKQSQFKQKMKGLEDVTFKIKKDPWLHMKGARRCPAEKLPRLKNLYILRDAAGKEADLPVFKILPHEALIELAARDQLSAEDVISHRRAHYCLKGYKEAAQVALEMAEEEMKNNPNPRWPRTPRRKKGRRR